ncbi:MAG TPA: tetratricopeptide repeat protein, partial [Tepidisphaeraceae bacterium]|nr:tetratricopeptide repeat protein [Tepidisphaeraceae bacterium]
TIQQNPRIEHPSLQNVAHYWRHGFMDLYIPVTYTLWSGVAFFSKALHGEAAALDPHLFHAASIAVHAINALLVFSLLRFLLKSPWCAAAGALLFALHPVQVETVAWTSGFKDLLCGMFSLIAINLYVRAVRTEALDPECDTITRRVYYALALVAMLLGMLSKPTAMVTPLLLMILDGFMLRRPWRRVGLSVAPFFLLAIPCIVWTKFQQPDYFLRHVPLWHRPLVAADALAFYLCKLVAPIHLSFDYGRAPWTIFEKRWVWITWVIPASIGLALFMNRKRQMPLVAGALLLVTGVAPVLGLTSFDFEMVSTVADHYLYLALLGPALAAAWALTQIPRSTRWPRLAACGALALLAARSADQARYWQDSRTLFTHAVELNPNSWSSWYGLGYVTHMEGRDLAALAEADKGSRASVDRRLAADDLLDEAMNDYRRTVFLNPSDVAAHHGYAAILMYFGMHHEAGREFLEVVRRRDALNPSIRPTYYADTDLLGQCFLNQNRPEEAVKAFQSASRLTPPPPQAAAHLKQARQALAARHAPFGPLPPGPTVTDVHKEEMPAGQ